MIEKLLNLQKFFQITKFMELQFKIFYPYYMKKSFLPVREILLFNKTPFTLKHSQHTSND